MKHAVTPAREEKIDPTYVYCEQIYVSAAFANHVSEVSVLTA